MQSADNTTTNGQDWSKTSKGGNDFLYDKLIVFVEHSETFLILSHISVHSSKSQAGEERVNYSEIIFLSTVIWVTSTARPHALKTAHETEQK